MFFQVSMTPNREKIPKKQRISENLEEIEELSLAPFSATPKLSFHDIKIGTTAVRKICIRNPLKIDIQLHLENVPSKEREVDFNWLDCCIKSGSEELLILTWQPTVTGTWRDIIQLTDGKRIRKDIPIVFKSIQPKPSKKKINVPLKKKGTLSKIGGKAMNKSSPNRKPTGQSAYAAGLLQATSLSPSWRRATYNLADKENQLPTTNSTFTLITEKPPEKTARKSSSCNNADEFEDSLEITSPLKPGGNLLNIPYTPLRCTSFQCSTAEKSKNCDISDDNISCHPCDKSNTSYKTYVKSTSGSTYVKNNLSGDTYTLDTSIGNLAALQLSPVDMVLKTSPFSNLQLSTLDYYANAHQDYCSLEKPAEALTIELTPIRPKTNQKKQSTTSKSAAINSSFTKPLPMTNGTPSITVTDRSTKKRSPVKRLSNAYIKKPLHLNSFIIKKISSPDVKRNPDLYFNNVCNPYILAQTSGMDPFMAHTLYYDPQWMDEQITRFKYWMNALLMPPKNLDCKDVVKVDIAKLWQDCCKKTVEKAPTKEQVSTEYNQNHMLQSLRKKAAKMYYSREIVEVLSKCMGLIENNKFQIRADKNIHQNVGLQQEILELVFCYNPLWLRIGLEIIFRVEISMQSNSDIWSLSMFLRKYFFNEPYLLKKYKTKTSPKYVTEIKKHVTKKFLSLVYFLDKAKIRKLIPYDPCLFRKNAAIKESKEILIRFSCELFSAVGDITKPLRLINYILEYKQAYIHEFEYGVDDLGKDLKDGVRLTRIMEVILLEPNLTNLLRVPAISRLQKIYNVKLAFNALERARYKIENEIAPKDIVDGHREKTLSFLWQIIYKFVSPRFTNAVIIVQTWWRSPAIQRKLSILREAYKCRINAAITIQRFYRRQILRRKLEAFIPVLKSYLQRKVTITACIKIQSYYRMYICRKSYLKIYKSVLIIQRNFRRWLNCIHKREVAAIIIQRTWRTYRIRKDFLSLKHTVHFVETKFIAKKLMRIHRAEFLKLKSCVTFVQTQFRAKQCMKHARQNYLNYKQACCTIQTWFKATKLMREQRKLYLQKKHATEVLQQRFRANIQMRKQRQRFLLLKETVLRIEERYQNVLMMRKCMQSYQNLKNATVVIQRKWKTYRARRDFLSLKQAVHFVETKFVAKKLMRIRRDEFLKLKLCVTLVQTQFRARQSMKLARQNYVNGKQACCIIQKWFRARKLMKEQRKLYLQKKHACKVLQQRFRANIQMRKQRQRFLLLKETVLKIEERYKNLLMTRKCVQRYQSLKDASIVIQRKFRANQAMKNARNEYLKLRMTTVYVQRKFRAKRSMKSTRDQYLLLRNAVIIVQKFFRARKVIQREKEERLFKLKFIVMLQARIRGVLIRKEVTAMRDPKAIEERRVKLIRKNSATKIQAFWRGYKVRKSESKKLTKIRTRLSDATKSAQPEDKVGERAKRSWFTIINRHTTMSQIIPALEELECVTRISPNMCYFIGSKICTDLYNILDFANQSWTDIEVASASVGILVNVAKYAKTSKYAWIPEQLPVLMKTMHKSCDKENALFLKVTTLLWVFGHNEEFNKVICNLPNFSQYLTKVASLCMRRVKIVRNAYKGRQVSLFADYSNLPLPILIPDWSVEYSHTPYRFNNSLHAIRSICELFNVQGSIS